jgi:hypothetical protein
MASDVSAAAPHRPSRLRKPRLWTVLLAVGIAAIVAGGALIAAPLIGVLVRGHADSTALNNWHGGAHNPVTGTNPDATKTLTCGSSAATYYALVSFGSPAQYHYAAVAGNDTCPMLNSR